MADKARHPYGNIKIAPSIWGRNKANNRSRGSQSKVDPTLTGTIKSPDVFGNRKNDKPADSSRRKGKDRVRYDKRGNKVLSNRKDTKSGKAFFKKYDFDPNANKADTDPGKYLGSPLDTKGQADPLRIKTRTGQRLVRRNDPQNKPIPIGRDVLNPKPKGKK